MRGANGRGGTSSIKNPKSVPAEHFRRCILLKPIIITSIGTYSPCLLLPAKNARRNISLA